ncbi:MAG: hypothetical protein KBG10_00480 [Anaerolineaceae bacterium]|nr:hypothetical protein [Anaerolineaceae bacterium]
MTYTLGDNCHIILSHPDIDSGAGYGFVCSKDGSIRAEGVQVIRQVESLTTVYAEAHASTMLWITFDILCADDLRDPNGAKHPKTRAQDYAKLMQFLLKTEGIILQTPVGAFANLGALGFSADERHHPRFSIIKCELNNVGFYFPPVDPQALTLSVWDGSLTWETSFWR